MVNVRVRERRGIRSRHAWIREMSANDPLTKRRNRSMTTPKPGSPPCPGSSMEGTYSYRPCGVRRSGGTTLIRALGTELETGSVTLKEKAQVGPTRPKVRMHRSGAHCLVRAMSGVTPAEQRGQVIHVKMESTGNRRNSWSWRKPGRASLGWHEPDEAESFMSGSVRGSG